MDPEVELRVFCSRLGEQGLDDRAQGLWHSAHVGLGLSNESFRSVSGIRGHRLGCIFCSPKP